MKKRFRYYPDRGFYGIWRWRIGERYTIPPFGDFRFSPSDWREVVVGPYPSLDAAFYSMMAHTAGVAV